MESIPTDPLDIDWADIRKLQNRNLSHGINKVGIPDLIIWQSVCKNGLTLWTFDKHFGLMAQDQRKLKSLFSLK